MKPDSATLGQWRRTHDYEVWTHCQTKNEPPLTLWEAHGAGVVRLPDQDTLMHVIKGGVPHHVEQLFGYWRACDSDIVWFRIVRDDRVHYAMVLGGCPSAYESDKLLWICPSCANVLQQHEIVTGRKGVQRFWRQEGSFIDEFNNPVEHRTCDKCGHVHPPAYRFRQLGKLDSSMTPEVAW